MAELKAMVEKMCQIQKHGGPDDEGIYADEDNQLVFGHRRLSLIDLSSGGHQPMQYDKGRYYITYNGELYNYPELKEELKAKGRCFTTGSDTEVILAAFATWGTDAFTKFNGMYAFALLDRATNDLFLARDPSGIKPLYYAITPEGLAFSSETKALASIPYLQKEHANWQVYLMAYGHLPEPVTTLQDVKPLTKGSYMRYHIPSGDFEIEIFSFYSLIEKFNNRKDIIEEVANTLQAAVKRHLISDAPIGVFLSGGLDSSIMAMLAKSAHQSDFKTLSICFNEARYSEQKYQDVMVKQLNCDHAEYLLQENDFHQHLPRILDSMDLPSCDGINTWFISKSAKENGLKAVLSGLGGDELFGGYPSFRRMYLTDTLQKLPPFILKGGKLMKSAKFRRMAYLSIPGPVGKYLFLRGQFDPTEIAGELDMDEKQVWKILKEEPKLVSIDYLEPHNQASWIETNMYMQNQLLRDSDVMSMAHGIEIRVPFLDKNFMKLATGIRSRIKYAGKENKQLLIDSFKEGIPEAIWKRPKMGFAFPFKEWLVNDERVKDDFMQHGIKAKTNYDKFQSGQMHWSKFMSLMLLKHNNKAGRIN